MSDMVGSGWARGGGGGWRWGGAVNQQAPVSCECGKDIPWIIMEETGADILARTEMMGKWGSSATEQKC